MRSALALLLLLPLLACGGGVPAESRFSTVQATAGQYMNPLPIVLFDGSRAESCPDPSIIHGQEPDDDYWYLYCTNERFADHARVHLLPISKSLDLVNWTYVGDVFDRLPPWVAPGAGLWAPDIQFFNGKYYLYYSASNTVMGGSAIFVATSDTPVGPWSAASTPVVEPGPAPCCAGTLRATIDSGIVQDGGQRYIFYGSFNGGISARLLSADGLTSDRSSQIQITTADRYEAPYVIKRDGYFYLMVSAGGCCDGLMSGYGVFAARSLKPLGPYIDKDGNSMLDSRVGGTPVIAMEGNRWIGPGHNAVATDAAGQDWMVYHAVDSGKPYFADSWTRRPLLIDPIEWVNGWPRVRNGAGASDAIQTAPVAVPEQPNLRTAAASPVDVAGNMLTTFSDEFVAPALSPQWTWIRRPVNGTFGISGGFFRFDTQAGQLYVGQHDASVLSEPTPRGNYMVETRLSVNVPSWGQFNFVQGGLLIFKDDANYIKLVTASINQTRQIEFAKQLGSKPSSSKYGSAFLASPADTTYLRIVRRSKPNGSELYTSYSSHDGVNWERGPTWTHTLGSGTKIGLVSMAGAGFSTYFDYVRVYALAN
ncbi:MAG TPA: family 43 glycosylhydrolase [Clostridia bacterium]|nr:family 43 glycosylhydrolase [Clostridia bacterium]